MNRPAGLLGHAVRAAVVVAIIVGMWTSPVEAHSALIRTSPGLDTPAGGAIGFVELGFNEPVADAIITVSYNQEPLAGVTTVPDGQIITFELAAPLESPGRYEVAYELVSFDGDYTVDTFFFTYEADAPVPARLGLADLTGGTGTTDLATGGESGGTDWVLIGVFAILAVCLIGVLALFVWRLDARRQQEPLD